MLYFRACDLTNKSVSSTKVVTYKTLRKGWNAFARLLDINWERTFSCSQCLDEPEVVIMDGITLGFRKDLLKSFSKEDNQGVGVSTKVQEKYDNNNEQIRRLKLSAEDCVNSRGFFIFVFVDLKNIHGLL